MAAASNSEAYEIELDADWFEDFAIWLGNLVTPDTDTALCTADLWLEPAPGGRNQTKIVLSTEDGDGKLSIVNNAILARVQKADINTLAAQAYRLSIRLNHPSGFQEPLLAMGVNVVPFGGRTR